MKIADPQMIKAGEQELIRSILDKLKPEAIESIASDNLTVDTLEFRHGDMIIHDNRIVYKMDFTVNIELALLFDREGNVVGTAGVDDIVSLNDDAGSTTISSEEESEPVDEDVSGPEMDSPVSESEAESVASDSDSNEMELVFQRNRDFWLEESSGNDDSIESEIDDGSQDSTTVELENVLQRNREYWESQTA